MIENLSIIAALFAAAVALVNIITQVVKQVTYDCVPTRVVAVIIAVTLCVAGVCAYCQIAGEGITWYIVVGAVAAGFVAAYCAMFGYDNLYNELAEAVKKITGGKDGD